jgi:hypothetical protein
MWLGTSKLQVHHFSGRFSLEISDSKFDDRSEKIGKGKAVAVRSRSSARGGHGAGHGGHGGAAGAAGAAGDGGAGGGDGGDGD